MRNFSELLDVLEGLADAHGRQVIVVKDIDAALDAMPDCAHILISADCQEFAIPDDLPDMEVPSVE